MSNQPLAGMRIAITRPRAQASIFADKLAGLGADVVHFPTIAIVPPEDTASVDRALAQLAVYDWIVFTSVNGVKHFWKRAATIGADMQAVGRCRVAAIGPRTADALRIRNVEPHVIPAEFVAEAIVEALPDVRGLRMLLPRADIARAVLREELRARGATVDEVAVYRTVRADPNPQSLDVLRAGVDVITFTSASTVRHFVDIVADQLESILRDTQIACIGPITAQAARELGLSVHVVANEYTIDGLTEAIISAKGETLARVDQ